MIVRKFSEAKSYEAPNHREYKSFRVFGAEMGGSQTLVFGISHFLPGGGAGPDASPRSRAITRPIIAPARRSACSASKPAAPRA